MDIDRILRSTPIDKKAAIVTSNVSAEDNEILSLKESAKNLELSIERAKKLNMSEHLIRELGKEKFSVQNKLKELKNIKREEKKDMIEYHFMEVCRNNMPPAVFNHYKKMACDLRGDKKPFDNLEQSR